MLPRKAYLTEREKAQYEKRLETDPVYGAEYEKAFEEAAGESVAHLKISSRNPLMHLTIEANQLL